MGFFSHQLTALNMYTYFNFCLNPICLYTIKKYFSGQKNVREKNAACGYIVRVQRV